ncbi:MAG: glycosyltransferase family 2 protein [Bacteroidales bacterium]|nr:glycosyltransferase family 2 protein [Bacteroidales bacterium]MCF8326946.1 glycosyltransferase family 2 protein [Bacteroidales bacterium]
MPDKPLVSIITINYKQAEITNELLNSLLYITYPNYEVIVVDNNSGDDANRIDTGHWAVKLVRSNKNLGFAGGNNLGVLHAKGKYMFFLNNDTEIDSGCIEELVSLLESDDAIGMVSPKIIFYRSQEQKTIQYAGTNFMNYFTGRTTNESYKSIDQGQYDDIRETNHPHGAAMMLPMQTIREVGLMPDIYFLYYEELDWAERIKRAGYKIVYCGKAKIYHKESMSVGKSNPRKVYYLNRNRLLFLRRNSGLFKSFVSFLFFTFIALPKNFFQLIATKKPEHAKSLISAYLWNLTHHKINVNPVLNKQNKIIYENKKR